MLLFHSDQSDEQLCPVHWLRNYIEASTQHGENQSLFLNPVSHKPLNASRLASWLVQGIRQAHTGRPVIKAHDVRKFAYSANWARKTDLRALIQHGLWESAHPFIFRYLINIPNVLPHFVAAGEVV